MRLYFLILVSLISLSSSAQPSSILHKSEPEQYLFLDTLWSITSKMPIDEGAAYAAKLKSWADANNDKQLGNELELLRIRRISREKTTPLIESGLKALLATARNTRNSYLEAEVLHAYADYLMRFKRHSLAFEYYLEAYNIYKKFTSKDFPPKQLFLYELGAAYYHFGDYENTVKYLKEALEIHSYSPTNIITPTYNNIALAYRNLGAYDSSEKYFRIIYEEALKSNDTSWIGIAGGNIGINYYRQSRFEEAIPLLLRDITFSIASKNIRNATHSMMVLASIYFQKKEYGKSEELLKRALSMSESKAYWPDYPFAEEAYTLLFKINLLHGNGNVAALYADSAITAKDSVASQFNNSAFIKIKEQFDFIQHQRDIEQLATQKRIDVLVRNGLILLIAFSAVIAILFLNRQRLRQKKLQAEKKAAESELNMAVLQLESFRKNIDDKDNIIEHFTNELERLKKNENTETETELLAQMESAIILTDEQWDNFKQKFEKVHKGFFVKLKKSIPDLTQAEIRFLALTKLKLTSKEMAAMLGISLNAIRVYRYRLRKRLQLDKDDMIEELVDKI